MYVTHVMSLSTGQLLILSDTNDYEVKDGFHIQF